MLRYLRLILALPMALAIFGAARSQEQTPIPTLVAPTLAPQQAAANPMAGPPQASAVTDIINSGVFRVGVLYNEPPYSQLTLQGELRGFDIDLLRLIAEAWESDVEFIQVTRENALDQLRHGRAHAVASAFVHYRHLDEQLEFSQSYLLGRQEMMVRADSPYQSPSELTGQPVGYVIGTRSETALSLWSARQGAGVNHQFYLNLDRAFAALAGGAIEGLVAERQELLRVTADYADRVRILDDALLREPRAFAVMKHDIALRQLLSHSIQLLAREGSLQKLYQDYFPQAEPSIDAITLWAGIGEAINPAQYAGALRHPSRYRLDELRRSGIVRVALNRALVHELGRRWAVSVEIVSSSGDQAMGLLASGEVDIVAGLPPDWRLATSIDFSAPYLLHGDRLMVGANSPIRGFNDLRGRIIGLIIGDEGARDRAQAWADSINASVRFFQTREGDAALQLLDFNNANAIYADSLLLAPHLQASPNALRLTDRWYSRSYIAFGLPYNDLDFRLLVNYTIQELVRDGTLERLSGALILGDELPDFELTPGAASFAGINLAGA